MSEPVPGLPPAPPVARTRDSASVILGRATPTGDELFWVLRGAHLRFSAGFYAFPGGAVDTLDAATPVRGASGPDASLIAAAARELFEEAGVLLARGPVPDRRDLAAARRALLDEKASFAEVLSHLGLTLDAADFEPAGRWITPDFAPIRFDARFFLARLPEGQEAEVWSGELASGGWVTPREALARWAAGEALLHPPALNAFCAVADRGLEGALPLLRAPPGVEGFVAERIEFQRGLFVFPLRTPTLPPARHTTCYLLGNRQMLLVDPGSPYPDEQERLARFVERLRAEGRDVVAILLTHHHADHVGGLADIRGRLRAPVWAHAETARRVGGADRLISDGEEIQLDGDPGMRWRAIHTPGHAPGHLCLFEPDSRALVCGDMVSGASTIVVDPPEGDMAQYLASLRRLAGLSPSALHPAHGPTLVDGPGKLAEYLAHREWRERRMLETLEGGPLSLDEIVRRAYDDTPAALHPLAARSALAALEKLIAEGRVARDGVRFALARP